MAQMLWEKSFKTNMYSLLKHKWDIICIALQSAFFQSEFYLFFNFFKVFIEFVTILLLFYVLVFWPRDMWDISSPTRDRTRTPWIGRRSLNHWTAREVPQSEFKKTRNSIIFISLCLKSFVVPIPSQSSLKPYKAFSSLASPYFTALKSRDFFSCSGTWGFQTCLSPCLEILFPSLPIHLVNGFSIDSMYSLFHSFNKYLLRDLCPSGPLLEIYSRYQGHSTEKNRQKF